VQLLKHRFMETEGSLPCSQKSSTGPYPEPDRSFIFPSKSQALYDISKQAYFYGELLANSQTRGLPFVGRPPLLTQYIPASLHI
jgi:hypothetical protein